MTLISFYENDIPSQMIDVEKISTIKKDGACSIFSVIDGVNTNFNFKDQTTRDEVYKIFSDALVKLSGNKTEVIYFRK